MYSRLRSNICLFFLSNVFVHSCLCVYLFVRCICGSSFLWVCCFLIPLLQHSLGGQIVVIQFAFCVRWRTNKQKNILVPTTSWGCDVSLPPSLFPSLLSFHLLPLDVCFNLCRISAEGKMWMLRGEIKTFLGLLAPNLKMEICREYSLPNRLKPLPPQQMWCECVCLLLFPCSSIDAL